MVIITIERDSRGVSRFTWMEGLTLRTEAEATTPRPGLLDEAGRVRAAVTLAELEGELGADESMTRMAPAWLAGFAGDADWLLTKLPRPDGQRG